MQFIGNICSCFRCYTLEDVLVKFFIRRRGKTIEAIILLTLFPICGGHCSNDFAFCIQLDCYDLHLWYLGRHDIVLLMKLFLQQSYLNTIWEIILFIFITVLRTRACWLHTFFPDSVVPRSRGCWGASWKNAGTSHAGPLYDSLYYQYYSESWTWW